jgi:dihydroflavonol-4-reductase
VFDADALMTGVLADACTAAGTRLVHTGGCFDRGDHGEDVVDEDTPLTPSPMGVGHARRAADLDRRHREDGLDVVRLSPGSSTGPGGLFASAFVEQARRGRLRCIGRGANWWSCVHVDDLAAAYVLAATAARPGAACAVVDDEPLRLRELTDLVTDALGRPRVGTVPPAPIGLLLGRTLVAGLTTSVRIRRDRIRRELGPSPARGRFRDAVGAVVAANSLTRPARTVRERRPRAQSVAAWNSAPAGSASSDPTACRSCSVRCCRASSLGRGSALPCA